MFAWTVPVGNDRLRNGIIAKTSAWFNKQRNWKKKSLGICIYELI